MRKVKKVLRECGIMIRGSLRIISKVKSKVEKCFIKAKGYRV